MAINIMSNVTRNGKPIEPTALQKAWGKEADGFHSFLQDDRNSADILASQVRDQSLKHFRRSQCIAKSGVTVSNVYFKP